MRQLEFIDLKIWSIYDNDYVVYLTRVLHYLSKDVKEEDEGSEEAEENEIRDMDNEEIEDDLESKESNDEGSI